MAADDVRNGKGRQTKEAVEIAQKRWPNVDPVVARRIYDDEYTKRDGEASADFGKLLEKNPITLVANRIGRWIIVGTCPEKGCYRMALVLSNKGSIEPLFPPATGLLGTVGDEIKARENAGTVIAGTVPLPLAFLFSARSTMRER